MPGLLDAHAGIRHKQGIGETGGFVAEDIGGGRLGAGYLPKRTRIL